MKFNQIEFQAIIYLAFMHYFVHVKPNVMKARIKNVFYENLSISLKYSMSKIEN